MLERNKAISDIVNQLGEEVYIINTNTYLPNLFKDASPLWYLGRSLELMSSADIVYFAKGWKNIEAVE